SAANPDDRIDEHLGSGTDFLEVENAGGAGDYTLSTALMPTGPPDQRLSIRPISPYGAMAVGDFTDDGLLDIAAPDGIHLGLGEGTFRAPRAGLGLPALPPGEAITAMIGGDFDGDGKLDLAVAVSSNLSRQGGRDPGGVFVLLGNGDGTFRSPTSYS